MIIPTEMADADVISKAEFARRRRVTPGRVSQWISEGKIVAAALVGEGRAQRIRETVACRQLRASLHVGQSLGNGLGTNLIVTAPTLSPAPLSIADEPSPEATKLPHLDDEGVNTAIRRARLEQIERQNRAADRQELVDAGRLTDALAVKQLVGREIARMVGSFEGALSTFATAISAEFRIPQRDVLHLLKSKFREHRAAQADVARDLVAALPSLAEFDPTRTDDQAERAG